MGREFRLELTDTRPKDIGDLEEAVDATGLANESLSGRGYTDAVVKPHSDWQFAEKTCDWAAYVIPQWKTDTPKKSDRHNWLGYNAGRLLCMYRNGCITEEDYHLGQLFLDVRHEQLVRTWGEERKQQEKELGDWIKWLITERIEKKTDKQVLAELEDHDHITGLDQATENLMARFAAMGNGNGKKPGIPKYTVRRASELTPKRVEHLWQDEIVLNSLALISGMQGEGKSTIATWLAAEITKGELEGALVNVPSEVVYLSFEEVPESTIWGRLKAMNADMDKVLFVYEGTGEFDDELVNLARSVDILEDLLVHNASVRAVVIDPIIEGLAGTNTDSETEVRKHLKALRRLCNRYRVTIILVTHWNKKEAAALKQRTMGSTAFSSVPRTNHAVMPDYEDPERKRRYFGCYKENASPEARTRKYPYRLVKQLLTSDDGQDIEAPRVEWEPVEKGSIEDYYNLYSAHSKTVTVKTPTAEQTERDKMHEEIARFIKREIEQSSLTVEVGKHKGRKYVLSKTVQDLVINKGLVKNSHVEKYQREEINKACNLNGIDRSRLGMQGGWTYMVDNQYWTLKDSI